MIGESGKQLAKRLRETAQWLQRERDGKKKERNEEQVSMSGAPLSMVAITKTSSALPKRVQLRKQTSGSIDQFMQDWRRSGGFAML